MKSTFGKGMPHGAAVKFLTISLMAVLASFAFTSYAMANDNADEAQATTENELQVQGTYQAITTNNTYSYTLPAKTSYDTSITCATFTPDTSGQYTFTFSGYSHGANVSTSAIDSNWNEDSIVAKGSATITSITQEVDGWSFTAYLKGGNTYYLNLSNNRDIANGYNEKYSVAFASSSKPAQYNLSTQTNSNVSSIGHLTIFSESKVQTHYLSWVWAKGRNDWNMAGIDSDFDWKSVSTSQKSTTYVNLIKGTDYTLSYDTSDPSSVGRNKLIMTAVPGGLCTGSCELPYVVQGRDISYSFCTVDDIPDQFYTGTAKTPKPVVHVADVWADNGSTTLVEGRDYTLSYENNTAMGTATVYIHGTGTFQGTKKATFVIRKCPANQFDIAPVSAQRFTGSAICPDLDVECDGAKLVNGTDYTVSYSDNVNVGMAHATISGIGTYIGSRDFYFYIRPAQDTNSFGQTWKTTYTAKAIDRSRKTTIIDYDIDTHLYVCDECGFTCTPEDEESNYAMSNHQMYAEHSGWYTPSHVPVQTGTHEVDVSATSYDQVETGMWSGTFLRLSGSNRYETMMQIVATGKYSKGGTVIIASGENFPDALAASGFAGSIGDCPVLLTSKSSLSEMTKTELKLLSPAKAYIVGGTAAVSEDVEISVRASVPSVERISGSSRYETALKIYKQNSGGWGGTAIIATGKNFADALSIAPYAYATKSPIFLADGTLDDQTVASIKGAGFTNIIIVGGTAAVPDTVKSQLGSGFTYTRLSGSSRYETSRLIAEFATGTDEYSGRTPVLSFDNVAVATGANFPDALAGAALCGKNKAVLLLVNDESLSSVSSQVAANKADVSCGYVLGGTAAVSATVEDSLDAAVQ